MAQTQQTIRFSIRENKSPTRTTVPYTARVHGYKTIGQEQIMSIMAGMNASVSRQEILVVFDLLKRVIRDILLGGDRVTTDLFNARVSVRGGFDDAEAEYSPEHNSVNVNLTAAPFLKKEVAKAAKVEKIRGGQKPKPELDSVFDYATLSKNAAVTVGNTAEVKGVNLDADQADGEQGIFFVNDAAKIKVRAEVIYKKTGTWVCFQVPELEKGAYNLVFRAGFGNEIREGRLEGEVSVN